MLKLMQADAGLRSLTPASAILAVLDDDFGLIEYK